MSAWRRLFAQAGFQLSGYHTTRSLHTVVEAVPVAMVGTAPAK